MKRRIVQITAGCTPDDAITDEVKIIQSYLSIKSSSLFPRSPVYAEQIAAGLDFPVKISDSFKPGMDDVILYHHSISTDIIRRMKDWDNPVFCRYHSITPSHFFRPYNSMITSRLIKARDEIRNLAQYCKAFFATSAFCATELSQFGCENIFIIPIIHKNKYGSLKIISNQNSDIEKPNSIKKKYSILFVGRVVPNKGHSDLIKTIYFLKKIIPNVKLILAGSFFPGMEQYIDELNRMVRYFRLTDDIVITGHLEEKKLIEHYRNADLFLCASHHEGFCVPLLEAMQFNVPVLAFHSNTSAVKDTMGGAGIGFEKMDHLRVAELAAKILTDPEIKKRVLENQSQRLLEYRPLENLESLYSILKESIQ